jgi:3-oxoacyl-[acyl-carrier-protein] synthase-1
MPRPPCRLSALGIVNALGVGPDVVWERLLEGEPTYLSDHDDLLDGAVLRVGAVDAVLPVVPASLAAYDCRNNAMALAAVEQIADAVARAVGEFGAERVGVVMGTSTSGVADAEEAIRHQLESGGLSPSFD